MRILLIEIPETSARNLRKRDIKEVQLRLENGQVLCLDAWSTAMHEYNTMEEE